MRILTNRSISFFCSFRMTIAACDGAAVRDVDAAPVPDCARTCLAISLARVIITTFERDVAIKFKADRAVKQVSVFGVSIPLSMLKKKT